MKELIRIFLMHELIKLIIKSDESHARWVNTLSYLEHIGSRKIIKSQNSKKVNIDVLQHIAEEARHAFFMKKICELHFKGLCPTFEREYLLGGASADLYFQQLDSTLFDQIEDKTLTYLYVTQLIEERALSVYKAYDGLLKANNFPFKLTSLISEETKHLEETNKYLLERDRDFHLRKESFKSLEQRLFFQLLESIRAEVLKNGQDVEYGVN